MNTCKKCKYHIPNNHPENCLLARGFIGIEMQKKGLIGECEDFKEYKEGG